LQRVHGKIKKESLDCFVIPSSSLRLPNLSFSSVYLVAALSITLPALTQGWSEGHKTEGPCHSPSSIFFPAS
jgi:hypothetical protein